jgi:glutamate racemase
VVATAGTIKSESYPLEIRKLFPDITVTGEACPMWVPLVENNEATGDGADFFIRKNLNSLLGKDPQIDAIILGCTHYPLLLPKINQYVPQGVQIITQGEFVAVSLQDYLKRHPEIADKCTQNGVTHFYTTEAEEKFSESAKLFLNEEIEVKRISLE